MKLLEDLRVGNKLRRINKARKLLAGTSFVVRHKDTDPLSAINALGRVEDLALTWDKELSNFDQPVTPAWHMMKLCLKELRHAIQKVDSYGNPV